MQPLNPQRPKAIDLFAGAGGMSLGLEQAGFDVVAAVEYDPVHCATHQFNFPDSATVCASVTDLTAEELCERAGVKAGEIDLIVGGPPCQGFSLIGKRSVEDARNRLVFEFHRLVVGAQARYFIMENVPGMKVGEHAGVLAELVKRFETTGYVCRPVELLNASDCGVPQDRTRLFLVGGRAGETLPRAPMRTTSPTGLPLPKCPTVWDAIGDLPEVDEYPELLQQDSVVAKYREPRPYACEMRGLVRSPDDFSYPRTWDPYILTSSLRTVHTERSLLRFAATLPGAVEPISRFLRLDPDGYCNTLRAGTDSKRGAYTSPRPIHPFTPRVITVREAARLHSFPDWFRFHATKWHGFRQVGNAVPPRVGRAVGAAIMKALGYSVSVPDRLVPPGNTKLLMMTMRDAADFYGVPADVVGQRDRAPNRG